MSSQKRAVTVTLLVAAGLCIAGSSRPGEPPEQVADQRLLDLEACIATLDERIEELENRVDLLTPTVVQWYGNTRPSPLGGSKAPPGAVPFQFNGMTYYYMPLSSR